MMWKKTIRVIVGNFCVCSTPVNIRFCSRISRCKNMSRLVSYGFAELFHLPLLFFFFLPLFSWLGFRILSYWLMCKNWRLVPSNSSCNVSLLNCIQSYTKRFIDVDKLNLAKSALSGLVLGSRYFCYRPCFHKKQCSLQKRSNETRK